MSRESKPVHTHTHIQLNTEEGIQGGNEGQKSCKTKRNSKMAEVLISNYLKSKRIKLCNPNT